MESPKQCLGFWELAVKKDRCSIHQGDGEDWQIKYGHNLLLFLLLRENIPLALNLVFTTCMINGKKWWYEQWMVWLSSQLTACFSSPMSEPSWTHSSVESPKQAPHLWVQSTTEMWTIGINCSLSYNLGVLCYKAIFN